jgi:hypothetical protein
VQTIARTRVALAVSCLAGLPFVGCGQPTPQLTQDSTTPTPPSSASRTAYEPPAREAMLAFAKKQLGPAAPASFGTTVVVTPRQPSVGPAELFAFGVTVFDPSVDPAGAVGNGTNAGSTQYGLWIRPNPGRPTLVDCEIAGSQSLLFATQLFSADGAFTGEIGSQTLSTATSGSHWSIAVPWDAQFSAYGVFRLMMTPVNAAASNLWGCQVSLVD